ncbi:MAG TPA: YabP/YqfC family sporulation protein [Candidatus Borkfalkia excrementigallinarum]|uniref:YabP/YqfC family sporulation protein n=1 Tax=Candidatus Borkfalkia excrementigallinarum TaxID=2838506 RepID=A0A9D1ZV38_9FIRM|nr:YabP/YqfC family sporulation protein [Candidatus Borkfalkia excrementigallinarum]
MEDTKLQTALIEQQKKIIVTGVESVDAFSAQQITLTLDNGKAFISGDGLKIVNFSKSNGSFSAVGKVTGVRFSEKKEKLSKRLFG